LRAEWSEEEEDDETVTPIDVSVRDEAVVERLASELKACGCEVRVHTEAQYDGAQNKKPPLVGREQPEAREGREGGR
jgi:hypothetical protein